MPDTVPYIIRSKSGIKRDGTTYESMFYIDGKWVRFPRGFPRKMLGYEEMTDSLNGAPHSLDVFDLNGLAYIHAGEPSKLEQLTVNTSNVVSPITDRTPAGFATSANNNWQFAQMYNTGGSNTALIAVACPNLSDIASSTAGTLYYGDVIAGTAFAALSPTNGPASTAGGICVAPPYLFVYSTSGLVTWSVPNTPTDFTTGSGGGGTTGARPTANKIVRGLALRAGAGNSPAALFWSLDSLVRATYVGGTPIFQFDTISAGISILSSNGVVEFDGIYYWPGSDRFYVYTGVVQELENQLNLDWFFDGINMAARQKVFGFKVPRFGEIWWCYPRGTATECTHAVIFNVRESRRLGYPVWYDTELPNSGRGAACFSQLHAAPFLSGVTASASSLGYSLWHQETGLNEVQVDGDELAVQSYFETSRLSMMNAGEGDQPRDNTIHVVNVEPDFVQEEEMKMTVLGKVNARATEVTSDEFAFDADTQLLYPKLERREISFRFESNIADGYYEMGLPIAHIGGSGKRMT